MIDVYRVYISRIEQASSTLVPIKLDYATLAMFHFLIAKFLTLAWAWLIAG